MTLLGPATMPAKAVPVCLPLVKLILTAGLVRALDLEHGRIRAIG